jgi:hypothetical protein
MPNFSQSDINAFLCLVAQRVAASPKVSVVDPEFKSASELLNEIESSNQEMLSLLRAFFHAYQAWHDVHVEISEAASAGRLSSEQSAKLNAAIANRDKTRNALLAAIAA